MRLAPPAGTAWRAFTQLFPTPDALVFTAPNLQYLLDSPIEFSAATLREFTVAPAGDEPPATIRVVVHHLGPDAHVDAFTKDVERIVLEQRSLEAAGGPLSEAQRAFRDAWLGSQAR